MIIQEETHIAPTEQRTAIIKKILQRKKYKWPTTIKTLILNINVFVQESHFYSLFNENVRDAFKY